MRRVSGYLLIILLLVLVSTLPAFSDTFFSYDKYNGTWRDVNKTANPDDDLMCWAAVASNILAWGNWGTPAYNTETKIFQYYVDHWTNKTGYMAWAWKWWFNGSPPPYTLFSYPNVKGGNFFPSLNFNTYYAAASAGNAMSTIDSMLHQGKGVGIVLSKPGTAYSHAVTVWGYSYSAPGAYTSIYITDSDDGVYGLRNYSLTWQNNAWYLGGSYSGWKIGAIQALGYDPKPLVISGLSSPAGNGTVPIAPSWVLFGTGLFSVFLMRRRRRL